MNIEYLKASFFLTGLIVYLTIETFFASRKWLVSRAKRLRFHFSISIINSVILRLTVISFLFELIHLRSSMGFGISSFLSLRGAPEIILSIISYDFFDYWWHRFNHTNSFLWRFHRVHHMDTHVDVTTALRFHPGELMISCFFKAIWVILWSPSFYGFIAAEISISFFSQFHHANFSFSKKNEKLLRKIFMSPELHTAHHSCMKKIRDHNYSTIFIFWDRVFKTYLQSEKKSIEKLGIEEVRSEKECFSYKLWFFSPFKDEI